MKKLNKLIYLSFLATVSCGPIYDTKYNFIPPTSSEGRACIFQCENSRSQCIELENYRNQDCQQRSDYDQRRCEDDIRYREGREPKWYECGSNSCSVDQERCESQFRYCYQSCGGRVDAQTVCVANCQGAPAPQPANGGSGSYQPYPRGNSGNNSIYPKY